MPSSHDRNGGNVDGGAYTGPLAQSGMLPLPFIRRALAQRLQLRRVPEIAFHYDESVAHQARVEELLDDIKREDAERAAATAPPESNEPDHE